MLTEIELLQNLAQQRDGTHNYAFTVSVAKSILRLRERYASQPQNFETIALEIQEKKFSQDSTVTQAEWDEAVRYILAKASENQDAFDIVKLYFRVHHATLPSYNTIEHKFPLKEVLILVWIALHDDKAYEQHYSGSDLEKLQQAKADQTARLAGFFQSLKNIQTGICHHGVRNELILSINETHADVNVIESPEGTIINFIRQRLHHFFWENYEKNPNLPVLRSGLITWMKESKVDQFFLHFDPSNQLQKDIQSLFEQYGIDPDPTIIKFGGKSLQEYIVDVQSALDFDCDKVRYPHLYEMQQLLTASDHFVQPEALEKIRTWMSSASFFLNMNEYQCHASTFYKYYTVLVNIKQYAPTFSSMNVLEINFMNTLKQNCQTPFVDYLKDNVLPVLSDATTIEQIDIFTKAMDRFKNDIPGWITTFFERWYGKQNNNIKPSLFMMMLNDELKDKICVNAQDIVDFKQRVFHRGRATLDGQAYWINRFFLTAIMIHPSQWSKEFASLLQMICVNLQPLNEHQLRALSLNPDGYPPNLFVQFRYLHEKHQQLQGLQEPSNVPERPENMLLHPELCETYHEWLKIHQLLSISFPEKHQQIIERYNERIWSAILTLPVLSELSPSLKRCLNIRENRALITSNPSNIVEMIRSFDVFYALDPMLVNEETRLFIKHNYTIIKLISPAIRCLFETSSTLINDKYLDMLTPGSGIYAIQIAKTVKLLYNANKAFLTNERCAFLKDRGVIARYLAQILQTLDDTKKKLITEANLVLMIHNYQNLWRVSDALSILYVYVTPDIITQFLFETLVNNGLYAIEISDIIRCLNDVKPELVTPKNFELINRQPQKLAKFLPILQVIQELIPSYITQDNLETLLNVTDFHHGIIMTLRFLQKTNSNLLQKHNLVMILQHSHQLIHLNEILSTLCNVNPTLINQENLNRFFTNKIELTLKVGLALKALSHSSPSQITNETIRDLFGKPNELTLFRREQERCIHTPRPSLKL